MVFGAYFSRHIEYANREGGVNKFLYSNALVAIDTIVKSVKEHKRNPLKKRAVSFLHQDLMMSPNMAFTSA